MKAQSNTALAEKMTGQSEMEPAKASASSSGHASQSPEWQLVQRIVASPAFTRSTLLTNFLLYVCDRKLRGNEDEITECQIGIHALGRPENYHPGEDNIVRNYARILRKRLEEFFEHEGKREQLRIVIPRGHYVPTFESVQRIEEPASNLHAAPAATQEEAQTAQAVESKPASRQNLPRRKFLISASMAAALVPLGWLGFHEKEETLPERLFHRFWTQIFNPKRESFIVTGDSALVLFERIIGKDIPLDNYVNGKAASEFHEFASTSPLARKAFGSGSLPHYTSTAALNIAISLDRLAMASHATPKVRDARAMRISDIKKANCVFIGGPRANPWIELFQPSSNFQMKFSPVSNSDRRVHKSIWNKRPRQGEQQEYSSSLNDSLYNTYTMVSFLPNINDEGWVLLLDGEILPGTEAAGDFVTNINALAPVLQKARRSDGNIGPFELILETQAVGAHAPQARVIVQRYAAFKS